MSTILIGLMVAGLFALAIAYMIKDHKKGGGCSSCKGCSGCDLSYDEVKAQMK